MGVGGVRKKTEGGVGFSGRAAWVLISRYRRRSYLRERVNIFRATKGRDPLEENPGLRFLVYGKSKEGYWGYPEFGKQTIGVMDVLEVLEPI